MRNAKRKYRDHKYNAARRGIGFDLTFEQWWEIWEKSGKYSQRGTKLGQYVMARKWDSGPYAAGNVEIQLCSENAETYQRRRRFRRIGTCPAKVAVGVFFGDEMRDPLELLCEAEGDSF